VGSERRPYYANDSSTSDIMRIPLNLSPGPNQMQFRDQLNSALRSISSISNSSGGFDKNGDFRSTTSGFFKLDSGDVGLTWSLIQTPDAVLAALEVEPLGDAEPPPEWSADANAIITRTLTATVAERQQPFFRRVLFNYIGPILDGEYWLPGFRLAPLIPADEGPFLLGTERVVAIDMNVDAIDDVHASALAVERARRYSARLSLIMNLGFYTSVPDKRWVFQQSADGSFDSVRAHLGFFKPLPELTSMPTKGALCKLGQPGKRLDEYYGVLGKPLRLPQETRRVLRGVDTAPPVVRDAFDRCARLYQVSLVCGRIYPSVGFAYRVAAVEAIVSASPDYENFSDFVRANVVPREDLDAVLDYLYGRVRSAHFHAGEFPSGEFERQAFFDPLSDATDLIRFDLEWRGSQILREAIVTWISNVLLEDSKEETESVDQQRQT
jgi:hypothetical protein